MTQRRFGLAHLTVLVLLCVACRRAPSPPLEVTASSIEPGKPSSLVVNGVNFVADADTRIELTSTSSAGGTTSEVKVEGRRLSIAEGVLELGSHGYGTVKAGDEVRIEERQLFVNGELRGRVTTND